MASVFLIIQTAFLCIVSFEYSPVVYRVIIRFYIDAASLFSKNLFITRYLFPVIKSPLSRHPEQYLNVCVLANLTNEKVYLMSWLHLCIGEFGCLLYKLILSAS